MTDDYRALISRARDLLADTDPRRPHQPDLTKPPMAERVHLLLGGPPDPHADPQLRDLAQDLFDRLNASLLEVWELHRTLSELVDLQVGPMSRRGILNAANTLQLLDLAHQVGEVEGRWSATELRALAGQS